MKNEKTFDFVRYPKRRIALLILYLGWEFDGLVTQADTENTVEEHLFRALLKTKLVEKREECGWSRCGRTDKGVSAFRQVVALTVRSTDVSAEGHFWPEGSVETGRRITTTLELPYIKMCHFALNNIIQSGILPYTFGLNWLNGVLPQSIRIIAFSPVHTNFSARFHCVQREYSYVFPKGLLILERLNDACNRLCGTHDFRNFCHIDRNSGRLHMSYIRTINFARIETMSDDLTDVPSSTSTSNPFKLLKLTVKANGFLWHQIRCIVALLWEIGCGNEEPELIDELFDIERFPARPQYKMANELPLCLFECSFPDESLKWKFDDDALRSVVCSLQRLWAEHQIKAANIQQMLGSLGSEMAKNPDQFNGLDEFIRSGQTPKKYVPIRKRPCCDGLEERRHKAKMNKPVREENCTEDGRRVNLDEDVE